MLTLHYRVQIFAKVHEKELLTNTQLKIQLYGLTPPRTIPYVPTLVIFYTKQRGSIGTTTGKFENGGFTLKRHQSNLKRVILDLGLRKTRPYLRNKTVFSNFTGVCLRQTKNVDQKINLNWKMSLRLPLN